MTKTREINITNLRTWMRDSWQIYASQEDVRLWVSFAGTFKVTDKHGLLIYYGSDTSRAVDLFNENIW